MNPRKALLRLGALFATFFFMSVAAGHAAEKPDLTGIITNMDGVPLEDASIFIYTAGPRVGPGYI